MQTWWIVVAIGALSACAGSKVPDALEGSPSDKGVDSRPSSTSRNKVLSKLSQNVGLSKLSRSNGLGRRSSGGSSSFRSTLSSHANREQQAGSTAAHSYGGTSGTTDRCRNSTRYSPSAFERAWTHLRRGEICALAKRQWGGAKRWLSYSTRSAGSIGALRRPNSEEERVLSWFCEDGVAEPIEPLSGMARHPFAMLGCNLHEKPFMPAETNLMNISYLVLKNQCGPSRRRRHGRNLLFDLGAHWYNSSDPCRKERQRARRRQPGAPLGAPCPLHSSDIASTSSIPLFYKLYSRNCIHFERIWAWEYLPLDPRAYWSHVPIHMRAMLHFYNIGVEREPSTTSVLAMLRAAARPEDFVVLKVDIDNNPIELSIVEAIAASPTLAALVDELFFEFHFEFDGLNFGWRDSGIGHTVDHAVHLMYRLRSLGIRAHFWV